MTQMPAKALGAAALLALIAGCGGGAQSDEETGKSYTLVPCLNSSELTLMVAPIDLSAFYPITSSDVSDVSVSTVLPSLVVPGTITITGHSSANSGETQTLEKSLAAKDGISISITDPDISDISVGDAGTECTPVDSITFIADGIPDHDTGTFPNSENPYAIVEQTRALTVNLQGNLVAPIALSAERLDGILFNGVPIQMREGSCAGDNCDEGEGPINPLNAPALYGIDSNNAHVLSDGSYHYHGDPHTLYDEPTDGTSPVIGFAADGLPIYGPWINDGGLIRKATSSYQLKTGYRPEPYDAYPYDGSFVDDYEYVDGSGDLDICNGMYVNGIYGYVVTDTFPYVMNCLRREPDPSFNLVSE